MGVSINSSPVTAGGTVYGGSLEGSDALRAADGTRLWQFPVSSVTGPAIGPDGTIYLAGSALPFTLYALRP
jgi:outer membrane protein assembly factor BamB